MAILARTEFSSALNAIANERGLDPSIILDTIKQAIVAAYKRDARERGEIVDEEEGVFFDASVDPESGEARIFQWHEGKEDKKKDVTPPGFGRIAAQTAKQVILQKIREAEKSVIMTQYKTRVGSLISGLVLRFDGPNVRVDLGRAEGIMPPQERIPNEHLNLNQRLTFLLKEIVEAERGPEIILSRADPEIVKKLFAREVPEIGSGSVEVRGIAREAGSRTKVAVFSTQSGVDPVGSCVGQKGVRVQAVITELNGEKIDVIPWTDNLSALVISSLAPAEGASVVLDEKNKSAKVTIPEDQLSLAIGRGGQNVQLASRLTGLKIEIEGTKMEEEKTEGKKVEQVEPVRQAQGKQVEKVEKTEGPERFDRPELTVEGPVERAKKLKKKTEDNEK